MSLDNKSNSYKMKCSCSKNRPKGKQSTKLLKSRPAALKEMVDYRRETLKIQEIPLMKTKRVVIVGKIVMLMPCLPTLRTTLWIKKFWLEIWAHGTMDHAIHTSAASLLSKTSFNHRGVPLLAKQEWDWTGLTARETHSETLSLQSETTMEAQVSSTTMQAVFSARFKSL